MPGLAVQNYATYPSMPGALSSIMPGFWWRDNGHKALCPLSPRLTQLQPGYCALVGTDTSAS